MDPGTGRLPAAALIGWGYVAPPGLTLEALPSRRETDVDVGALLHERKLRKLMAKQDRLALAAAAAAVEDAGLGPAQLAERTGIYLCVGLIPFAAEPLAQLCDASSDAGRFSPQRFADEAFHTLNPLLTFQCLPNMPVFHISRNLGMRGRYFVTYPGPGQWFQALGQALADLAQERVDFALVGAVADQCNPLVEHYARRCAPQDLPRLIDSACVWVLARTGGTARASIRGLQIAYRPVDPALARPLPGRSRLAAAGAVEPALLVALSGAEPQRLDYAFRDGISAALEIGPP